jgi:hypothetical protein
VNVRITHKNNKYYRSKFFHVLVFKQNKPPSIDEKGVYLLKKYNYFFISLGIISLLNPNKLDELIIKKRLKTIIFLWVILVYLGA